MHLCSIYLLLIFFFLISVDVGAQFGWVENKSLGPGRIWDVVQEPDGGLTILGDFIIQNQQSARPGLTCHPDARSSVIWLTRLDPNWNIVWEQCYGGSETDRPVKLFKQNDTTYVVFFWTQSEDGDLAANNRSTEIGVMTVDQLGIVDSIRFYGGSAIEVLHSVSPTEDGGYILGTQSNSADGDVPGHYGPVGGIHDDAWIVKLNDSLHIDWTLWWGGSDHETYPRVAPWIDGSYAVALGSASDDFDLTGNSPKARDVWLLQLDNTGKLVWQKKITHGDNSDYVYDITVTSDSNLVLVGKRNNYYCDSAGRKANMWVAKVDTGGNVLWDVCYGDRDGGYYFNTVVQTSNGNILNGRILDDGGDVSHAFGSVDVWLVQLDNTGGLLWEYTVGGSRADWLSGVKTNNGLLTAYGNSESDDHDLAGIRDSNDYTSAWLFQLELYPVGMEDKLEPGRTQLLKVYPNPTRNVLDIEMENKGAGPWEITIYNNVGHIELDTLMVDSRMSIDVSHLSPGVYYIHGQSRGNKEQFFGKFILMR